MEVSWLHLIPLFPLLGAILCGLAGRWLPKSWLHAVALVSVLLAACVGVLAFTQVASLEPERARLHELVFPWFSAGNLHVDLGLMLDRLSGTLVLVITGVGFLIHLYSVAYMEEDPAFWRFFAYLNLFVAAMLLLVLGDNLVAMFVGWEGVGLCSYLLIGFWFDDEAKAAAGKKAFIVNRIGDFGFLIGIFILYGNTGSVAFNVVNAAPLALGVASAAAGLLFLGACGKSAQLPLYIWLPDAMAGPTPVSALIHAATMVTAGVYMIARLSHVFVQAPGILALIAIVGALTALLGALIGTSQTDIKKILAYSTVSQLGFMFIGVGVGAFFAGTMHLLTHAFFKACLFLGSGAVIHGLHGEQDVRKMGGLRKGGMPHTAWTFLLATIAITGVLPFSGFWSKDEILAQAHHTRAFDFLTLTPNGHTQLTALGTAIYVIGTVTALLTSFYMWRCYLLTFEGEYRGPAEVHPHESPWPMTGPLWVLAFLSVAALVLGLPEGLAHSLHLEGLSWEHFTEGMFARTRGEPPREGSLIFGYGVALLVAWIGAAVAYLMYGPGKALAGDAQFEAALPRVHRWLENKLYVDEGYAKVIVRPLWALARGLWRVVDVVLIDGLIMGAAHAVAFTGRQARRFQNGDVQRYAAVTAAGVAVLIYVFLSRG